MSALTSKNHINAEIRNTRLITANKYALFVARLFIFTYRQNITSQQQGLENIALGINPFKHNTKLSRRERITQNYAPLTLQGARDRLKY